MAKQQRFDLVNFKNPNLLEVYVFLYCITPLDKISMIIEKNAQDQKKAKLMLILFSRLFTSSFISALKEEHISKCIYL